jgi:ribosome-associated protein
MLIRVTRNLQIAESDLEESFIHASGPGGQNVNKVATSVELRFNLGANVTLPEPLKVRLARLAGKRLSGAGILIINAEEHRSQLANREAAREKLFALIREAAIVPKVRRATKPTKGSQTRRLDSKSKHSALKRGRSGQEF